MAVSIWEGNKAQTLIDVIKESNIKDIMAVTDMGLCVANCLEQVAWISEDGNNCINTLYNTIQKNSYSVDSIRVSPKSDLEIYTHNDVDDLRRYIDVIGTSSGVDAILNGYTLSGNISTTGDKTITVDYMGKTATFTVNVKSGLPSGYTAYDYMELNQDKAFDVISRYELTSPYLTSPDVNFQLKQYADISHVGYDVLFSKNKWGTSSPILGYRETGTGIAANAHSNAVYTNGRGVALHALGGDQGSLQYNGYKKGVNKVSVRYTTNQATCKLNDNPVSTISTLSGSGSYGGRFTPMFNPQYNISNGSWMRVNVNSHIGARVGQIKLYLVNSDSVDGNYIPCVRDADSVMGYYDLVGGVFYTTNDPDYATINGDKCVYDCGKW